MIDVERRRVMQWGASLAAGATLVGGGAAAAAEAPVDTGNVEGGKVAFPPWTAPSERPGDGPPNPLPVADRVGFAVLGLGRLALEEIIPAFAQAKRCRLVALVSGTPTKARTVAAQYGVSPERVFGYDDWARIAADPAIEVVYVVTPNAIHKRNVLDAAAAGKHVLCEKPMATSSDECRAMIEACAMARRTLMVAYRCQYEPHNRLAQDIVRDGRYGVPGHYDAVNVQNMAAPDQWRLRKALAGGGALPDIGLYCLNGIRFLTGEEPVEVFARTFSPPNDDRFREVEASVAFSLRFPGGLVANAFASYALHETRRLGLNFPAASLELENAFAYEGQRLRIGHRAGKAEAVEEMRLGQANQFALEMDHMAECVRTGRAPRTPGAEGLQDHVLMEAIYRSAAAGQPVALAPVGALDATRGPALPPG